MEKINRLTDAIQAEIRSLRAEARELEEGRILLRQVRIKREIANSLENIINRMIDP